MKLDIFILLYCYLDGDGYYTESYIDCFDDYIKAVTKFTQCFVEKCEGRLYTFIDEYPNIDENNPIEGYYKIIKKEYETK
jgi:hypothetical protein